MNFELTTLFGLSGAYLLLLFGIAFITEKGWIPDKIVRHPLVYVLSLGVFASVWAYYTAIGNAQRSGYGYLAPYFGISLAFLLSPLLLRPMLVLSRRYQLSSLADVMAFRYRSPWTGTLATLVILVGVTPLISLQIQAVANTFKLLAPEASQGFLAFSFCILITLFSILFGTRKSGRRRDNGLIMALAFESLIKLLALLLVGAFAIKQGFGSFDNMNQWLAQQPELLASLRDSSYLSSFHITALLFFTASVAMPHMFYLAFNENNNPRALTVASWALPLYFLLLSLPVLPILWAGLNSGSTLQVEYFPVIIGMEYGSEFFTILGYLGGVSAASGLIIVITLALSNMCLNHLILPISQPTADSDIYRWLLWRRRLLITALIWSGFLFYYLPDENASLQVIATVAFTSCLQFLPGIIAILYWPQGNKKGVMAGLLVAATIWFSFLMLPMLFTSSPNTIEDLDWQEITIVSLILNSLVFIAVSRFTHTSDEERSSADVCALDILKRRKRTGLVAKSPDEFIKNLSKPLGSITATREVYRSMSDLDIDKNERRPYVMRSLRGRLEANLSGLLGPSIAREIIDSYLPYSIVSEHGSSDVTIIEHRIDSSRSNLSGMAADLDNLRRYHRQILLDLPLGVCSLGNDQELIMWNRALENFTGISNSAAIGSQLKELPAPWGNLLQDFVARESSHSYKQAFELNGSKTTVNLHKSLIEKPGDPAKHDGVIILLEDVTEMVTLETGLTHSERLASIGRLAAGVAHEIGNPITGIACLAQNIRDEFESSDLRGMAEQIIEQTDRTSKILQSLVNFAHAGKYTSDFTSEPVSVAQCIDQAKTLILLDNKNKDLQLHIDCQPGLVIAGDAQLLLQILINLLNNAKDASQSGAEITITARSDAKQVEIAVTDQGVGIPAAIRDRVFEPFFTTKEAGEGTGLGLSLVFSIVEDFGGTVEIESPVDKVRGCGARVILRFPCYDALAEQASTDNSIG